MERELIEAALALDDGLHYIGENVVEPETEEETNGSEGEDAYAEYLRCFGYGDC